MEKLEGEILLTIKMSFSVSLSDPEDALKRLEQLAVSLLTTMPPETTEQLVEQIYEAMNIITDRIGEKPGN